MGRLFLRIAAACALSAAPAAARAEPGVEVWPESVRGAKMLVPAARGPKASGSAELTRSLRSTLTGAVGPLVPSKELSRALRKMRQKGAKRRSLEALASAGRTAGADYVLRVDITKKGWLYTAHAVLIDTESGEARMDFRAGYYKSREAADRGLRIARKTIEKLDVLIRERAPAGAAASVEAGAAVEPPGGEEPILPGGEEPAAAEPDDRVARAEPEPRPEPEPDRPAPEREPGAPSRTPSPAATSTLEMAASEAGERELLRLTVTGGSGLLRTYDVSSASITHSGLSHRLEPLSLIHGAVELSIPGAIAILASATYRPVRYLVTVGEEDAVSPGGMILEGAATLGYPLALGGQGLETIVLVPYAGAGVELSNVAEHPGNIIVSSTAVAAIGGLFARIPLNRVLEIEVGAGGGYVLSYRERPATSGEGGRGFSASGDLAARIWLSRTVGIALSNRFALHHVAFQGTPTRQVPSDEAEQLANVAVSTKDLRTSIGLSLRL